MTDRDWRKLAVAAIVVTVLGGFRPLWPSAVRLTALAAGVVLGVLAVVVRSWLRRRLSIQQPQSPRNWGGANDESSHRQSETNPELAPRPDQRWSGLFGG